MKFLHTADWQLGKPFAGISDDQKRSRVRQERFTVIQRIGDLVRQHDVSFVLVAGDLFDSNTADKSTVSNACSAIGQLKVPVVVIPGNHDHGGQGSLWNQDFFLREQQALASNLRVLLEPKPLDLDDAVILPCPLLNRLEQVDPTAWLRNPEVIQEMTAGKTRIILAHGSTQQFTGDADEEDQEYSNSNLIHLDKLPLGDLDYIALGDWHGCKQVGDKAWYAGTPERDRFPTGESNQPGHVLLIEATRGQQPHVESIPTGQIRWHEFDFEFHSDQDLLLLEQQVHELTHGRANEDLLKLTLSGSLGLEASARLDQIIEAFEARLLRLKLTNQTTIAPTSEEITALSERHGDPLISSVATELLSMLSSNIPEKMTPASLGLRELFKTIHNHGGSR